MKRTSPKKKVFVGLSGGVDSSVSAVLLKKAGYEVTGVFIKVWQPEFIACTTKEDRLDAMRVAARLGIPFKTLNLEKEYKREVVDYMLREYAAGRTPNPDAMCNKEVKFGAFLKWAVKEGADYVATGHYARNIFNKKTRRYELLKGKDGNKDQSYFLWNLTQKELARTLFPVGHLKKTEVRKLARKFGLITAEKKDSQGLCFMGKVDMKEFLSHFLNERPGRVQNERGETIGTHRGAMFYTLGERHGFTITKKGAADRPQYVIGKDIRRNTITVSADPGKAVAARAEIRGERPVFNTAPHAGEKYEARFRYRGALFPAKLSKLSKREVALSIQKRDYTISPGQSLVLYDGDTCLGGAVIA